MGSVAIDDVENNYQPNGHASKNYYSDVTQDISRTTDNATPLRANIPSQGRRSEQVNCVAPSQSQVPHTNGDGYTHSQQPNPSDGLDVLCGPLLNYQHVDTDAGNVVWHGSVLIVTAPQMSVPRLDLEYVGATKQSENGASRSAPRKSSSEALQLYGDTSKTFWRFSLQVPLGVEESTWQYTIPGMRFVHNVTGGQTRQFVVPAATESMRIMFHSCNGFSAGTDEDFWSGPALWNDVLRVHEKRPFHVMLGGGDQIYNDGVRVDGPLKPWTNIGNPQKRRAYPFNESMRVECDKYYLDNYIKWYSTEPFASANAIIPQVNIWDDHDIIDGFGSYTDGFMRCAVFRGIGGVSFKYYCLFQHHTAPPKSTFTTDAPQTTKAGPNGTAGVDSVQLEHTHVYDRTADDPSWIVGRTPGPYVEEVSRSLYMRLGKRIAFCGIDARTERTRRQVNYLETYDLIFNRVNKELSAARGEIKHLILLLGIPIAYPRLAWLENIITSPLIGPLRLLNKRFGVAGDFFNHFDGQVDLLDDLDDHYTSKLHKKERRDLVVRLQKVSEQFSVRITILGGDVHLAALGRFYSNPKVNIEAENDPRYMVNVISSAITNKPPPKAVANLLARRNKIHHLHDGNTDETLLKLFNEQPGGSMKSAEFNKVTMPSRNYAIITEIPEDTPNVKVPTNGHTVMPHVTESKGGHSCLHIGEEGAGSHHPAADGITDSGPCPGGLNVAIMVEIDNHDREGQTQGYGLSIPKLELHKSGAVPSAKGSRPIREALGKGISDHAPLQS